jgi:hypothetical protein
MGQYSSVNTDARVAPGSHTYFTDKLIMTEFEARMICELRLRYSLRALAEAYYPPSHLGHGCQMDGSDLLDEATRLLGRSKNEHPDDFIDKRWDRTK